jgi:hypothetical protein
MCSVGHRRKGQASSSVWLKDPDGNILNLTNM